MSTSQPQTKLTQEATTEMPSPATAPAAVAARNIPLTLIVATTPSLGIGLKGNLPWPALRAEMAYFARVTKRVAPNQAPGQAPAQATRPAHPARPLNSVIMGRKTYESIPARFRPLKDRVNIVLSRSATTSSRRSVAASSTESTCAPEGPFFRSSLRAALDLLGECDDGLGRVFVIGGAEVYAQAARLSNCRRVLRTRIEREYECDVRFPLDLEADDAWRCCSHGELEAWIGESVPERMVQDGDDGGSVHWRYEMWEREGQDELI